MLHIGYGLHIHLVGFVSGLSKRKVILLHYKVSNCIACSTITFCFAFVLFWEKHPFISHIPGYFCHWFELKFLYLFSMYSFFTSCFCLFCTFLIPQVLKPLGDNLMEENIRQSVTNSIKAGLTDQASHHARLKTDWQFISSWTPLFFSCLLYNENSNKNKPKFTINCRSSLV